MCAYCVRGEKMTKKINQDPSIKDSLPFQTYLQHKALKDEVRAIYNNQVDQLKLGSNECVINIDFKENVKINISSNEIGNDWFTKPSRTIFGVTVSIGNGKVLYFDIISPILTHTTPFVVAALKKVLNSAEFKALKMEKVHFWMDNTSHFRNRGLFSYFCSLKSSFSRVTWNFFVENHGKSLCDSRFGVITKAIQKYVFVMNNTIKSTSDLITCIQTCASDNVASVQIRLREDEFPLETTCLKGFVGVKAGYHFEVIIGNEGKETHQIIIQKKTADSIKYVRHHVQHVIVSHKKPKVGTDVTKKSDHTIFNFLAKKYATNDALEQEGKSKKRNNMWKDKRPNKKTKQTEPTKPTHPLLFVLRDEHTPLRYRQPDQQWQNEYRKYQYHLHQPYQAKYQYQQQQQ